MSEKWKIVPDYDYEVSDIGNVRRVGGVKNRELCPAPNGYLKVDLWKNNKRKMFTVSRLVMLTWIGECPDDLEVAHNDGDIKNNKLTNLRYATKSENSQDRWEHGTMHVGSNHVRSKLNERQVSEIKHHLYNESSQSMIGKLFNVSRSCISSISTGRTWSHVI